MNARFIETQLLMAEYRLNPRTSTSYCRQCGDSVLPMRFDLFRRKVPLHTRNPHRVLGSISCLFKSNELSKYKLRKPYKLSAMVRQYDGLPGLVGVGDLKVGTERGMEKTGDLLLFFMKDDWRIVQIYDFAGMAYAEGLQTALDYLRSKII